MRRQGSSIWFFAGIIFATWLVMLGIQKISPYFAPGRVEYDSGQGWKEFQVIDQNADVRDVLLKRLGSDFPSMNWKVVPATQGIDSADPNTQTETYTLPAGASVKEFVIQRSLGSPMRFVSTITPKGMTIPMFSDGVLLNDGVYSISTKDKISRSDMFEIKDGELYFAGN